MNDAEELTSLEAKEQEIVIELLKEDQLGTHQLRSLVRKTKELRQSGQVSKAALRSSLRDLDKSLKDMRIRVKLKRLHWSLGPHNLKKLLDVPELKVALDEEGVDYSEFLQVTNKAEARLKMSNVHNLLILLQSKCRKNI